MKNDWPKCTMSQSLQIKEYLVIQFMPQYKKDMELYIAAYGRL